MTFEWKDEYAVGDTTIDNGHQRLVELANVMANSPASDELTTFIMHLYKHSREHFEKEEILMREHAYPNYERHVEDHNEMLARLVSKSAAIRAGHLSKAEIIELMTQWVSHITSDDQLIRDYL